MALRDISDQKQAVDALVRAKADWEQTFDAVPDLIALLDANHRITRVNRAMAERLGCTPEQAVGHHCYEALHGLSAAPDFCPHARMMDSGKEEHAEVVEGRLGGVFEVTLIPLRDEAGDLFGCVHIARDITARKRLEEEIIKIATREKQRIGRDLHDGVAQQLAAAAYLHHILTGALVCSSLTEAAKVEEIDAALHQCLEQIRQMARGLLPVGIDEDGLVAALQYLIDSTSEIADVNCRLEQSGDPVALDGRTSSNLYYLVREAMMNAVRHGRPRAIVVSLAYGKEQLESVEVQDDGSGFDPAAAATAGMGLQIMHYRADVIGGVLTIDSRPGGGTRITCRFPV